MIDEHDVREMLQRRAHAVPATPTDTLGALRRARRRLVVNGAVAMIAAAAVVVTAFAGVDAIRTAPVPVDAPVDDASQTPPAGPTSSPTDDPTPARAPVQVWDPVREGAAVTAARNAEDPIDASLAQVDVRRVSFDPAYNGGGWNIELAADWPPPGERGLTIAYGLVLDTTGDSVADLVIGIDNGAPDPRSFRVWITDQATGETIEQVGPPYGYPIEFSHPAEPQRSDSMSFTFLPGSAPQGFDPRTVRYYVWAFAARDGQTFASEYAPDAGWLTLP